MAMDDDEKRIIPQNVERMQKNNKNYKYFQFKTSGKVTAEEGLCLQHKEED